MVCIQRANNTQIQKAIWSYTHVKTLLKSWTRDNSGNATIPVAVVMDVSALLWTIALPVQDAIDKKSLHYRQVLSHSKTCWDRCFSLVWLISKTTQWWAAQGTEEAWQHESLLLQAPIPYRDVARHKLWNDRARHSSASKSWLHANPHHREKWL